MNVYDFDDTIYDGDSSKDFLIYMCRKHPVEMLLTLPGQAAAAVQYLLGKMSKEEMKEAFFAFLGRAQDIDGDVKDFWDKNQKKIKQWYRKQKADTDVVISASPEFLLRELCAREQIPHLIATRMDKRTGKIRGKNCKGQEKVVRFLEAFPKAEVDRFYSDHPSDRYMAKLARKSYLVKGNMVTDWKESM